MIKKTKKKSPSIILKKIRCELNLYKFPHVQGLEDVLEQLNNRAAGDLFEALHHAFPLKPVRSEESARQGERMIEYLGRAFESRVPMQVEYYQHILLMLLNEFDDKYYVRGADSMAPHEFLKTLLDEDSLTQRSLVPECFKTVSQVSEFLRQKKGRETLKYEQAVVLGEKFHVDPLLFLRRSS
jgi:hypothetical protein